MPGIRRSAKITPSSSGRSQDAFAGPMCECQFELDPRGGTAGWRATVTSSEQRDDHLLECAQEARRQAQLLPNGALRDALLAKARGYEAQISPAGNVPVAALGAVIANSIIRSVLLGIWVVLNMMAFINHWETLGPSSC